MLDEVDALAIILQSIDVADAQPDPPTATEKNGDRILNE
jgi:hypothetical protein